MKTLFTIIVVAGLAAAAWMLARHRALRGARHLHRELSTANGLSEAETAWLWQIANSAGVADPALVFLQPSLLEAAAGNDPARVDAVRRKLFGG